MKILVTGATGFLGRRLVRRLSEAGHDCRCLVRPSSDVGGLSELQGVKFFTGDITKPGSLAGIEAGIEVVFHLAARMGHVGAFSATREQWEQFRRLNVEGLRNVADRFVESPPRKFIYISSTAAMGLVADLAADETTPLRPKTPYQCSKAEAEELLRTYFVEKKLPIIILRPSVFYGPGMVGDLYRLAKFAKKGLLPHLGWGKNLSPLMHVDDLVEACLLAMEQGRSGETYIITSARAYEMRELTQALKAALQVKPREFTVPVSAALAVAFLAEVGFRLFGIKPVITLESVRSIATDRQFSIAKAQRELGFVPKRGLEECVKDSVAWLREQKLI